MGRRAVMIMSRRQAPALPDQVTPMPDPLAHDPRRGLGGGGSESSRNGGEQISDMNLRTNPPV